MIQSMLALAVFASAAGGSEPSAAIALPVAEGRAGNGPFTIQVWPDEGCKGCEIDSDDLAALRIQLDDLHAAKGVSAKYPGVQYLKVDAGSQVAATSSIDKIRKALVGCEVGATGKLATNPTSQEPAFGVRFNCAATRSYRWMSVVMSSNHRPKTVYFLPGKPIYVARTR